MGAEPQIVNVLGEQVAFQETGFSPAEKFLVFFDEKYKFPNMTAGEEILVKKMMGKLFSGSKDQPSPPCSPKEKSILLKSLQHRFHLLRNELVDERESGADTLRLRQILDHIERLKEYIDFAQTTTSCDELDESILAETVGDLTDEQIQQLLRQFVFFILQGQKPLEKFTGKDPNPKGFIGRLQKNPIHNFQDFLTEYRDKKYEVPLRIEKVLQATGELEDLQSQIQKAADQKSQAILLLLQDYFKEDDPFWENVDKKNLEALVQKLLEVIENLKIDLEQCKTEKDEYQGALIDMSNEKDVLEEEKSALLEKLRIVNEELERLKRSALEDCITVEEFDEVKRDAQEIIEGLRAQIARLEARVNQLSEQEKSLGFQIQSLQSQIQEKEEQLDKYKNQEQEIGSLQAKIRNLEEQLQQSLDKLKDCEALEKQIGILQSEIQSRETQLSELRQHAGKLTLEIDAHLQEKQRLLAKIKELEKQVQELEDFKSKFISFKESLTQDYQTVMAILGDIQRVRSASHPADDSVLQSILQISEQIESAKAVDPTVASKVAEILTMLQKELDEKQKTIQELQTEVASAEEKIKSAKKKMDESSEILELIQSGKEDLTGKGFQFENDTQFLQDAFRALEAERDLDGKKKDLDEKTALLTAKNQELVSEIEALKSKCESELATLRKELQTKTEELEQEKATSATLQSQLTVSQSEKDQLQASLTQSQEDLKEKTALLEQERLDSQQKLKDLEEQKIRECEERLENLRIEEEKKRKQLITAQGTQQSELEAQIAKLLQQITDVEGERDKYKAELEAEKAALARLQETLAKTKEEYEKSIATKTEETIALRQELSENKKEIEDLQGEIVSNSEEKAKLYQTITAIVDWISSGAPDEKPSIDEKINSKYGMNRLFDAVMNSLPKAEEKNTGISISTTMSRCYLVFFLTYIYSRHFPLKMDKDYNYQSEITAFYKGVLAEIYKQLDVGIPGKLEKVGSGGIPIQLKSKYVMNMLMPLIKQMELLHESGKKGSDFLKYSILDKDQLATLHKIHRILLDKLKLTGKDFLKTLNGYVQRRTGSAEDDIENVYLRFYQDSKTMKEYPVVMYITSDMRELPKFTFASEQDFTQYLASTLEKSATTPKVQAPLDKALVTKPILSFNMMFYLFLFIVKDYLSSVEGELDSAGCPLPHLLKRR